MTVKTKLECGCFGECDDMGHFWKDFKKARQDKRYANLDSSTKLIVESGVNFTAHNCGVHLRIEKHIDFWPSTGKWIDNSKKPIKKGRGVFSLLRYIDKSPKHRNEIEDGKNA